MPARVDVGVPNDVKYQRKLVQALSSALGPAQLRLVLTPEMAAKLQEGQVPTPGQPRMPCALLNCEYSDGTVTLNVYPDANGFECVWTMDTPRAKWLPFLKKTYTVDAAPLTPESLDRDLSLVSETSAAETMEHFASARPTR